MPATLSPMPWLAGKTLPIPVVAAIVAAFLVAAPAPAAEIVVAPGEVQILDDDLCSLAEAIGNANFDAQVDNDDCPAGFIEDTIVLAAGSTYTLTEALPEIFFRAVLEGQGATVERNPAVPCILDGSADPGEVPLLQVGTVAPGLTIVTLRDLTLRGGCNDQSGTTGDDGGAIVIIAAQVNLERVTIEDSQARGVSGGIDLTGAVLTVTDSVLSGNFGRRGAGAIGNGPGSETTVVRSAIFGNSSGVRGGGGIGNDGYLRVVNSTVSGNSSTGAGGGGIGNAEGGVAEIVSGTIWDNSVSGALGGGGIGNAGMLTIKNSIVGSSDAGGNCVNVGTGTFVAEGANLDTDASCAAIDPVGFSQVSEGDLALSPAAGPAAIHGLEAGSVAVDAAPDCTELDGTTPVSTDQRGVARPQDGDGDLDPVCDVGAYERSLLIFEDGFESGGTSAWSATVGG